MALGNNHHLFT